MNRKSNLFVPTLALNRNLTAPLHRQIYETIAHDIRRGTIPRDARLPSTRMLAKQLRVSRNTVLKAYEELADAGLIAGEQGSCMLVLPASATGRPLLPNLHQVIRQSGFPARVHAFEDQDGNPLYLNF